MPYDATPTQSPDDDPLSAGFLNPPVVRQAPGMVALDGRERG